MSPLSTFLDGRPYTQLRGAAWLALSDLGHVLSGSVVSDGGGGGTTVWTSAGTVPCRIDPLGSPRRGGQLVGGRIDERATHIVTLPAETPVLVTDRFAIDGRGTFEITEVRDRTNEWSRVLTVVPA